MAENPYRVDLAIFDPSEGADEPSVVGQTTTFGASLEGAIANAIVTMAPHICHMGYEFAVISVGVWCDVHGCFHEVKDVLGHADPPAPELPAEAIN